MIINHKLHLMMVNQKPSHFKLPTSSSKILDKKPNQSIQQILWTRQSLQIVVLMKFNKETNSLLITTKTQYHMCSKRLRVKFTVRTTLTEILINNNNNITLVLAWHKYLIEWTVKKIHTFKINKCYLNQMNLRIILKLLKINKALEIISNIIKMLREWVDN